MNKTNLPVPVLAGPTPETEHNPKGAVIEREGEAREKQPAGTPDSVRDSRGGQKLFVIRKSSVEDRSRFFFYAVKGSEIVERVTARSASLIWDYLESNWPTGTRVYWIIL